MRNSKLKLLHLIASFICLVAGVGVATVAGQEARSPAFQVLDEVRIEQRIGEQVPLDLVFTDASGAQVVLGDLVKDRPVILSMVLLRMPDAVHAGAQRTPVECEGDVVHDRG